MATVSWFVEGAGGFLADMEEEPTMAEEVIHPLLQPVLRFARAHGFAPHPETGQGPPTHGGLRGRYPATRC